MVDVSEERSRTYPAYSTNHVDGEVPPRQYYADGHPGILGHNAASALTFSDGMQCLHGRQVAERVHMQIDAVTGPVPEVRNYIQSTAEGKLCHLPEWGLTVARALNHEPFYLIATEGDRVCGVLPLMVVKSGLLGNRVISQAFSNYGGPLAEQVDVRSELLRHAVELARQHQCPVVEIRSLEHMPGNPLLLDDKVCMVLPLAPDLEEMWRGLRSEIRNRVRKAEKSGLVAVSGGEELLDDFYDVWTVRMRQLGTPCYSRCLFHALLRCLPEYTRVFLVKDGQQALAAGFFHHFNGLVECRWAAAHMDFNGLSPNTLLYWSAVEYYCLAGQHRFDFGRSTIGSSQYEFKRRWGGTQSQLYYQYWTEPGHELSPIRPDNPRYKRMVAMWKRLPLCATRILGPSIGRCLA